ncbi:cytochrome c [Prosthecobacter fusiformis]|uniref:Cytochrome c n=1 Tax=Prosthecobacter fusiformis TaxID=48464 RepID=A0A4R7SRG0_9BACT|nr:c-type cytochrome [Prosthecobacter fusiformis]TDU81036.1 cytochrome c [Prosthecobacter fusiformis]
MTAFLATTPVPRDLPLPLPLPEWVLISFLVIFFLVHILFVNLMVGGSVLVTFFECLGRKSPRWDSLAHSIAQTVTVNKSLAVVMGIGPLLCINLVYTMQWYSANALTGHAWLMIVPLVTVAFLLTYLHKYKWESWSQGGWKTLHLWVGLSATLLLLFVPLIFLANVNLMLFPGEWEKVRGFFSSLRIGNVLPRYLHFLAASIAMTGLFLAGWLGRAGHDIGHTPGFSRPDLRRLFYKVTAWVTLAQFVLGPLLLFTLPAVGITTRLYVIIFSGAALGFLTLLVLFKELRSGDEHIGRFYVLICIMFSFVVLGMGTGRHVYRQAALAPHQADIQERTSRYAAALAEFNQNLSSTPPVQQTADQLFMNCAACHAPNIKLVGPPLTEIAEIYAGNPDGIVAWAKTPGKKRPELPQMPPFAHLGDESLRMIAELMLEKGKAAK